MSIFFGILGSGSSGNGILCGSEDNKLLIDVGFSGREAERRLRLLGTEPEEIKGILVTHEHLDHVKGVGVLSRRFNIPVYATKICVENASKLRKVKELNIIYTEEEFEIGNLKVNAFSVPHDASDPIGFVISNHTKKAGVVTDLGYMTTLARENLKGCDVLIIESNHDVNMLMNGEYSWELKQRVRGKYGHLSNEALAESLEHILDNNTRYLVLAHLSQDNNMPEIALAEIKNALGDNYKNLEVLTASQNSISGPFSVED